MAKGSANLHKFIFPASQADLFSMFEANLPVHVRVHHFEFVTSRMVMRSFLLMDPAPWQGRCFPYHIGTGLIKCYGIKGSRDADIRNQGLIVEIPAVTIRRYLHDKIDMKMGLAFEDGHGILRYFPVGER